MADNTKLAALYSEENNNKMVSQNNNNISVPEDSCILDMNNFSSHPNSKDATANSRITLQRSLSRKGVAEKIKLNGNTISNDSFLKGSSKPEKAATLAGGSPADQTTHHQITVTTTASNITASSTATENRFGLRRNSFKRSSSSSWWAIEPKRVLLFFATLSSMGTILLIYLTLSIAKFNVDDQPLA